MKRNALLVALAAATLLSVAVTAFTVLCIGDSIDFWYSAQQYQHGGPAISGAVFVLPFLLALTALGWLAVRWQWRTWKRMKPPPPAPAGPEGKAGT